MLKQWVTSGWQVGDEWALNLKVFFIWNLMEYLNFLFILLNILNIKLLSTFNPISD